MAIKSLLREREGGALLDVVELSDRQEQWVSPEALDRFRKRFVFAHQFQLEYGLSRSAAKSLLDRYGVKPMFNPHEFGAMIYRRADLPSEFFRRRSEAAKSAPQMPPSGGIFYGLLMDSN